VQHFLAMSRDIRITAAGDAHLDYIGRSHFASLIGPGGAQFPFAEQLLIITLNKKPNTRPAHPIRIVSQQKCSTHHWDTLRKIRC
jgi:hypothetical protein